MAKLISKLPRAAGLFGGIARIGRGKSQQAENDALPDMDSFEANYERELLRRAVAFTTNRGKKDDIAA